MSKILLPLLLICFSCYKATAEEWNRILQNGFIGTMANTSRGIIAGEFDSRLNLNPYNGLLISKDLGITWNRLGLDGRGITDFEENNDNFFATTFYTKDGAVGLFRSNDFGQSWDKIGPNFSASALNVDQNIVYLGGYSHGLWVSKDAGNSFVQKIGTGLFGPKVLSIGFNESVVFAGTPNKTYVSTNKGESWTEINSLNGKQIGSIVFANNKIFVGTSDLDGIYTSSDNGQTWTKSFGFGTASVGTLAYHEGYLYGTKVDSVSSLYSLYKSGDLGLSWENTSLNLSTTGTAQNIDFIYAEPRSVLVNVSKNGIYKANLPTPTIAAFKFMQPPWETQNPNELIDKITTFFDHEFPLLGYLHYNEPTGRAQETLNFFGVSAKIPLMYYSSHSGIDFALPFGTEVLAPANGIASYFFCEACGYSIKIDHQNGYQSIYEHLQKESLITASTIPVTTGTIIGKVGLSGNTTGPHLHFEVIKDSNTNNMFSDDFPHGRVDPFGWLDLKNSDPWENYEWIDNTDKHTGQKSKYLWFWDIPQINQTIVPNTIPTTSLENIKVNMESVNDLLPYTINFSIYPQPQLPFQQNSLRYIPNTSFILNIVNTVQKKLQQLPQGIPIEIDLANILIPNVILDSIKLYYFDDILEVWVPLTSSFNITTKRLDALITHLSHFAVFGEAVDRLSPITTIKIAAAVLNGWYTEKPLITFASKDEDVDKIFYSLDKGITWEWYLNPFVIDQNGIVPIIFKSFDNNGNIEEPQKYILKINFLNLKTKTLTVRNGGFSF